MNPRVTVVVRDVRSAMLLIVGAFSMACARGLGEPLATNPAPPGLPTDTTQYKALLAQYPLTGSPHTRKRCPTGLFCFSKIDVTIQARGTTSAVDPANAPASPVPVAHLVNLDKKKIEKYYGLLPGDVAEYDLWVNRKPASTLAEWRIVGVDKVTNQLSYGEPTDLTYCHKFQVQQGATDADFADDVVAMRGDCTERAGVTSAAIKQSSLGLTQIFHWVHQMQVWLLTYSRTGGGWIECPNGCCT